jgi:hypothetical protein
VAIVVLFGLLFMPWTGVYPGGYRIYTQNAFQTIWGGVSVESARAEALDKDTPFDKITPNPLMVFYILLLVIALVVIAGPIVAPIWSTPSEFQALPAPVRALWAGRVELLSAIALGSFIVLMIQLGQGFGLERAVATKVDQKLQGESGGTGTAADVEKARIQRGVELGQFNLAHSVWLHLAVFVHVLLLLGMSLQLWLKRRGRRPLPRIEAFS